VNKKVDQRAEKLIDAVESVAFFPGIVAPGADIISDEGVIVLFGEIVVVFVIGTATGEAEGFRGLPPVDGVAVNEPSRPEG
jgi:hypothetical protein